MQGSWILTGETRRYDIASGGPAPGTPPLGADIGQDLDIYGLRAQYS